MDILKQGKYPEENKIVCKECGCKFQYYNSEIITEISDSLEHEILGGIGVHKYLKCPTCDTTCTISYNFFEDKSIFSEIAEWFKSKLKKE